MDDTVLVSIGRQYIDQCVRIEQLLRANQQLSDEVQKLKAEQAKPAVEGGK